MAMSTFDRIPLYRHFYADSTTKKIPRAIDNRWHYSGILPQPAVGFNPFSSAVFFASRSRYSSWRANGCKDARAYNLDDILVRETLTALHDYLHVWSYHWIADLAPKSVAFGKKDITSANFEDYVFCHILSEAVATAGLDYWYLSTINLDEVLQVGTCMNSFSVDYHVKDDEEFRRMNPKFDSQKPDFLRQLVGLYCTGVLYGFNGNDLARSPKLMKWLRHEIEYSEKQRALTRSWFSFLSVDRVSVPSRKLVSRIASGERWQKNLVSELGTLLWEKMKDDKPHFNRTALRLPKGGRKDNLDYRFVNYNRLQKRPSAGYSLFLSQLVSSHDYLLFDHALKPLIPKLFENENYDAAIAFFKDQPKLKRCAGEPRDLFLP